MKPPSPVLPLDVLQLPVVLLQVFSERCEVLSQKVLKRLLLLGADDLARRETQAKLLCSHFHFAWHQTSNIISTVLAEANHH